MKFITEQKGQTFLVVNESTGEVRGRYRTKGEADVQKARLQKIHNDGIEQVSGRLTPPKDETLAEDGD